MQRLFSAFPEGWPGTGLILLRAVATIPLFELIHGAFSPVSPLFVAIQVVAAVCSALVAIGLWTPAAASLLAISEVSLLLSSGHSQSINLVMAVLGAAIAMIGPGAWSLDARLFGRKRIRVPQR